MAAGSMTIKTIAFLYPGAMGASLAATLHNRLPHLTLLTSLPGRSRATIDRAEAAGLQDVPLSEVVRRSDVIISILPPSAAVQLAQEIIAELPARRSASTAHQPLVFIDANAISPETAGQIAGLLKPQGVTFIDSCIIGLPATSEDKDPKVFLSSAPEDEGTLQQVADVLSGGSPGKGLAVEVMHGAGAEAASALKMCYGGINKGSIGLGALLVLTANAHSPQTADALMKELSLSAPGRLEGFTHAFPDMIPKAYRWVGEMEEIASFIRTTLKARGREEANQVAATYEGIAQVFQRLADDLKMGDSSPETAKTSGNGGLPDGREGEVESMLRWAEDGKVALQAAAQKR